MFAFKIVPEAADDGSYGGYMDVVFAARDESGAAIAGWTECWLDIVYLDGSTDGWTWLPYTASAHRGIAMSALTGYGQAFYYRETLSASLVTWLNANLGRQLIFVFYAPETDKTSMKVHVGEVSFGAKIMDTQKVHSDRLAWIRNDVENVVFPRLKRLLALSGENLLLDSFGYDSAGNITSLRIRTFDSKANAEAATEDITDTPEVGEVMTLTVEQEHSLPRNVRSKHLSTPSADADDATATDNMDTDAVNAPGNSGSWPA